jgi:hypothetical protein
LWVVEFYISTMNETVLKITTLGSLGAMSYAVARDAKEGHQDFHNHPETTVGVQIAVTPGSSGYFYSGSFSNGTTSMSASVLSAGTAGYTY